MTLLHAAVKCNPPLELVLDMIEICPELTAARDCLGRTPLHVAAGSGAAPSLIKILVHVYPAACDVQDADGKTPLHFACDSSCVLFADDTKKESSTPKSPCHDVICALLSGSLAAATIEDADEMNPIENAIMSSASLTSTQDAPSSSKEASSGCVYDVLFVSRTYHDVAKDVTQSDGRQRYFMLRKGRRSLSFE